MIKAQDIAKTILSMVQDGKDPKAVLSSVLQFVSKHHLEQLLPRIASELEQSQSEIQESKTLSVYVAHPLSASAEDHIRFLTGALKAPITVTEEKKLIGGFRARYQNIEYEGSLGQTVDALEEALKSE